MNVVKDCDINRYTFGQYSQCYVALSYFITSKQVLNYTGNVLTVTERHKISILLTRLLGFL